MPSNCAPANSGKDAVRDNPFVLLHIAQWLLDEPRPVLTADHRSCERRLAGLLIHYAEFDRRHARRNNRRRRHVAGEQPARDPHSSCKNGEDCATNATDLSCQVATIVTNPSTPGSTSATLFNHYSLLGTAEQLLALPFLGHASGHPTMTSTLNL
jgi:hypothetical protein